MLLPLSPSAQNQRRRYPLLHSLPMAVHPRKLLNDSAVDQALAKFCEPFCENTDTNPDAVCPLKCMDLCPCSNPVLLLLPPPPLSPETPVPVFNAPQVKSNRLSLFLTISLAILATTFFIFTCYTIYRFCSSWHKRRRQQSQQSPSQEDGPGTGTGDFLDEDQGPLVDHPIWYIRTVGLQPSVISAITIVKYKRGDGLIEGTDCSVCLSEFQEDETLRLLPKCNHAFHIPCIDTWLRSHTNCPMCRAGIMNNAAPLPSQELVVQDSGPVEEAREGNIQVSRESENGPSELRISVEEEGESGARIGLKRDEDLGAEQGMQQPMRRSVSLDSLSASMISSAIANHFRGQSDVNSDNELVQVKESPVGVIAKRVGINQSLLRLVGSPSIERTIQTGSSAIKRSLSCSAKVFLSSRNRNSDIPQ